MKTLIAYLALCAGMLLFAVHASADEFYPGFPFMFGSQTECEQHYYHCELNNYQINQALGMCAEAMPPLPECDQAKFGNGQVWKPVSESTGRVVVVLSKSYCDGTTSRITSFEVLDSQGNEAASAKLRYCGQANGGRAHYDLSKKASDLPDNLTLVVETGSSCDLFSVPNPESRYD